MSIIKKILFTVVFVVAVLVVPAVLLLLFVDAAQSFSVYVIVYGIIIFTILGYIVASIRSMEMKFNQTMDEIKKQNAAIAYKLTNNSNIDVAPNITVVNEKPQPEPPFVDSQKVTLNPAEPLVMPGAKAPVNTAPKKVVDDNFDDFK